MAKSARAREIQREHEGDYSNPNEAVTEGAAESGDEGAGGVEGGGLVDAGHGAGDTGNGGWPTASLAEAVSEAPTNGHAAPAGDDDKKKGKSDDAKKADFSRLASSRASDAMDALNSLGRLANMSAYSWSEEQESKIFNTLAERIDTLRKSFAMARIAATAPDDGTKRSKRNRAYSIGV